MAVDYGNTAKQLGKNARAAQRVAGYSRKKEDPLQEARELYELAADTWIKEAKAHKDAPRRIRYGLLNARQEYKSAADLAESVRDKERIQRKIDSISQRKDSLRPRGKLEKNLIFGILSIASLVMAFSYISLNITGYSIGGLMQENFRWMGVVFFVLGLIFAFFYSKNKR